MTIKKISSLIHKKINNNIYVGEENGALLIEGEVNNWNDVVSAGYICAESKRHRGVINNLSVKNLLIPKPKLPDLEDNYIDNQHYNVVIVGGGIIGCSIARELSKWDIKVLLIDKENDFAMHTSSRNDGMIHPGLTPSPGTKKAFFNVKGNKLYSKISEELQIDFKRVGSLITYDDLSVKFIKPLISLRAKRNEVEIHFLNTKEVNKLEPNLNKKVKGGIFIPSTGIISPYKTTFAYIENAIQNGVFYSLNTYIKNVLKDENNKIYSIETNRGKIKTDLLINCAGVYSDYIAEMAGDRFFTIHPRKGEVVILDKNSDKLVNHILANFNFFGNTKTKGGGIVKTLEGNVLLGPNAYEQPFKENYTTTLDGVNKVFYKEKELIDFNIEDVITYFSGTRASTYKEDFIIENSIKIKNLIHVAGIQSPGLASAPAISEFVEKLAINYLNSILQLKKKTNYNPKRINNNLLLLTNNKERNRLINENPDFGKIICRCEGISVGEIKNAINSVIPSYTIDGIKRRTRAGMGRCQGGFCSPLIMDIIHQETGIKYEEITKKGIGSYILYKETKFNEDDYNE